jgi:hypothetical protein
MIVFIIVIIVMILIFGGIIFYLYNNNKTEQKQIEDLQKQNIELQQKLQIEINKKIPQVMQCNGKVKSGNLIYSEMDLKSPKAFKELVGINSLICDDGKKLDDYTTGQPGKAMHFADFTALPVYSKLQVDQGFPLMSDCVGKKTAGYTIDGGKIKIVCK